MKVEFGLPFILHTSYFILCFMIYSFNLYTAGLVVGALLIAFHAIALINAKEIRKLLIAFPRSKAAAPRC